MVREPRFRALLPTIPALLLLLVSCQHQDSPRPLTRGGDDLILQDANVVDVEAGTVMKRVDVVIQGKVIVAVGVDAADDYDAAQKINLDGRYVIPGLIEAHTHITPEPEKSLTVALKKGVVAARDMGGDGAYLKELQDAVLAGELQGPNIYFSAILGGPDLIMTDTRVKLATPPQYDLGEAPWARLVVPQSDVREIIRDARECGATGIKIYSHLSGDLVEALSTEAHAQGLKVWAHAVVYPATAFDAIAAGVEVLSHSAFLLLPEDWQYADGSKAMTASLANSEWQERVLEAMSAGRVTLDPTLIVGRVMFSSITDKERVSALRSAMNAATKAAFDRGITLVAGTDSPLPRGFEERLALHEEIELLVTEVGLAPIDALRAATINGAEMLGIADDFGLVAVGRTANLVVLKGNPLTDIHNIEKVDFVLKDGQFVN